MTLKERKEITKISKAFASEFESMFGDINETGWLIVDPLSGYLNFVGYENRAFELPECENHPQVLMLEFNDGDQFIPAGGDLNKLFPNAKNWMWI